MLAGHFGLAAAVKAKVPEVPLWALMLSTQLIDVIFIPLYLTNVEIVVKTGEGYANQIIHADYTHSLLSVLIIAFLTGLLASKLWGRRGGLTIGAVVFSHWILDLLVHRPDLPILPGNLGDLPLLGLGLWSSPIFSIAAELVLITAGSLMYLRYAVSGTAGGARLFARCSGALLTVLMLLCLASDVLGTG
ncbi:permease [Paenibacillus sp. YPG26]|uniref:permease n=1 Tax=Paenibacillus sp. YPG26 TaxID=2878915 RepID=UPI00203C387F|nr:permease [Paenibacillus sp. YPG26]USB34060.1 permease [Paenibacillus sp. YPG26]